MIRMKPRVVGSVGLKKNRPTAPKKPVRWSVMRPAALLHGSALGPGMTRNIVREVVTRPVLLDVLPVLFQSFRQPGVLARVIRNRHQPVQERFGRVFQPAFAVELALEIRQIQARR